MARSPRATRRRKTRSAALAPGSTAPQPATRLPAVAGSAWPYASAPEAHELFLPASRYELFVGGRWMKPKSGRYLRAIDPSTEETLTQVARAGAADVDAAVRAARNAYDRYWRRCPGSTRAKYLYRIARSITERSRELAVLESLDTGKPIREARDFDIPLSAAHFFYYAGWADKLGWAFPGKTPSPLGVAGQVIP